MSPTATVPATSAALDWGDTAATIDRLNRTDPRAALDVASGWLAREQHAAGGEGHTRALRAHAHALRSVGTYDAAIAEYEDAEACFRALGLDAEAARTEIGHVTALRFKGRYEEGMELALRTKAYFLERGDQLQAAKLALNLGTVYRPMGRLTDALKTYQEARRVFRRLGEEFLTATAEQNIGNVLVDLGRYQQALRHLRAAERIRRRLGLQADLAQTLMNIGILSRQRGDYGYALVMLNEAGQIDQTLGDERSARVVDLELLPTCLALNLREESRAAAERAIAGMRRFEMPFELGQALLAAAGLAELDDDVEHAGAYIDEAHDIFGRLGNRVWSALARLRRARLALRPPAEPPEDDELDALVDAPPDESEAGADDETAAAVCDPLGEDTAIAGLTRALAECHEVSLDFQAAGALDLAASGWLIEAAILAQLADAGAGDHAEALARYGDVLQAAASLNADHLLYQAHAAIGALLHLTDPDAAISSYRHAIDHLEAVRARARADDLKLSFLSDKASLYEQVVGLLVEREEPDSLVEAYSYVERSKSRTLLEDLLGGASPSRGGQRSRVTRLAQHVRDLRARLNSVYVQAYNGDAVPTRDSVAGSGQAEAIAELEQELTRSLRDLQLAARAEAGGSDLSAADDGVPTLPAETALVEFYAVGEDLLAFVVTADGLHLRRIASVEKVARLAERLSFQIGNMTVDPEYVSANLDRLRTTVDRNFQQLYKAIVAPLEDVLEGHTRLVVVPHGPLHGLPFHAFHDGTGYLAERFTIAYAPSAGVYQAGLRAARSIGDRMVVVGIDDPGLPWVGYEVDEVVSAWPNATVLRGRSATARGLRRQVGRIDALHLATHGVFRADNPAFSSIKLTDSWLTVNDLAEVARGAQLVTLSACESGVNGLSAGDEVIGLTRGLLAAGCSTIVASLWTVSDESTAHLMADFYRQLQTGEEPAAALQAAMLGLRARFDHPYYWAAFAVIGGGLGRSA